MWVYNNQEIEEEEVLKYEGFVYKITNNLTGQKYIGRKYIWSLRKQKNKTRRQKIQSDWRTYFSSHKELKESGKLHPELYTREIIHLCKSKAETNFKEVMEIIKQDALWKPDYMNDNLSGKYFRKNVEKYFL